MQEKLETLADILRHRFDLIALFLLVVFFAFLSMRQPNFFELEKEVIAAFLTLVSREAIGKLAGKNNGNGQAAAQNGQ